MKKQRHHFADKVLYSQSYGFSRCHVRIWEFDHKEGWVPKNSCFWIVVLEKTLENPLVSKEIKPMGRKGNQPWIFINIHWCWSWNTKTLATWCKELVHWKRPWCWERFRVGGEEGERGWDGWMVSLTQWT